MTQTAKFLPLILCGPSGSGKSTMLQMLLNEHPTKFGYSISHTTRKPRAGEADHVHYHFTDIETMEREVSEGKFIESAIYSGNKYGTSFRSVEHVAEQGKICLLDIDIQGVVAVKKSPLKARYIFVKPPSMEVLEQRLRGRNTETEASLKLRLDTAKEEMAYADIPEYFDLVILNDDIQKSYPLLRDFALAAWQQDSRGDI